MVVPVEVFVSYASEDEQKAYRLVEELKTNGIEAWFAQKDLEPGVELRPTLRTAIREAGVFLACLSNAYIAKFRDSWLQEELRMAIDDESDQERKKIIPVRLEVPASGPRPEVPEVLGSRAYADLSSEDKWKKNLPRLVAAIRKYTAPATQ